MELLIKSEHLLLIGQISFNKSGGTRWVEEETTRQAFSAMFGYREELGNEKFGEEIRFCF